MGTVPYSCERACLSQPVRTSQPRHLRSAPPATQNLACGHAARRAPTAPPSCPPSSMRFEFPALIRHSRDFRVTFRYIGRSRETDSVYDALSNLRSGARRQSGAEFSEFTLERAAQTPPTTRRRSARGPWPTPVGRFARGVARREKPSVPRPNRSPRGARTCPNSWEPQTETRPSCLGRGQFRYVAAVLTGPAANASGTVFKAYVL
jgi:hypothetical protein